MCACLYSEGRVFVVGGEGDKNKMGRQGGTESIRHGVRHSGRLREAERCPESNEKRGRVTENGSQQGD